MTAGDVAEHEREALVALRQRLLERYPAADPAAVDEVIDAAYASLTGPIRDFVPLLVERAAQQALQARSSADAPPSDAKTR